MPSDNCSVPTLSIVATDITEVQSDCYPDSWNDSVCMECNDFEEIDDDQCSCKSSDYYEESETAAYDLRSDIDTISSESDLVYPGARISNAVSMLLIMTFVMTHKITGVALKDLLSLVDIHCLMPHHLIPVSIQVQKVFRLCVNSINTLLLLFQLQHLSKSRLQKVS